METFHILKCKIYPHDRLNSSKGAVRSNEFYVDSPEEIKAAIANQLFSDHKWIIMRGIIEKNIYIYLHFII